MWFMVFLRFFQAAQNTTHWLCPFSILTSFLFLYVQRAFRIHSGRVHTRQHSNKFDQLAVGCWFGFSILFSENWIWFDELKSKTNECSFVLTPSNEYWIGKSELLRQQVSVSAEKKRFAFSHTCSFTNPFFFIDHRDHQHGHTLSARRGLYSWHTQTHRLTRFPAPSTPPPFSP